MKRFILTTALAASFLLGPGCVPTKNNPGGDGGTISGDGVVHRGVGPECVDVWHVATKQGGMLWPVVDPAMQVDGLPVRFTARERTDVVSICMAGKNVEFTLLEKR
jgi:hypothetical protein